MRLRRLLERIGEIVDAGRKRRRRKADSLKKLLRRLRKKQRRLEHELATARSRQDAKSLERKLDVVRAHRRKGLRVLRELRDEQ